MHVDLKQPRGDGERCVTPARAAAKDTSRYVTRTYTQAKTWPQLTWLFFNRVKIQETSQRIFAMSYRRGKCNDHPQSFPCLSVHCSVAVAIGKSLSKAQPKGSIFQFWTFECFFLWVRYLVSSLFSFSTKCSLNDILKSANELLTLVDLRNTFFRSYLVLDLQLKRLLGPNSLFITVWSCLFPKT